MQRDEDKNTTLPSLSCHREPRGRSCHNTHPILSELRRTNLDSFKVIILNSQVFNFKYHLDLCCKLCWFFIFRSYILLLLPSWWMQYMEHFGISTHNFTVAHVSKSFCSVDSQISLPLKFQAEPHTGNLKQVCVTKTIALNIGFIFNIGGSKQTPSLSFILKDMRTLSHFPTRKKPCILLVIVKSKHCPGFFKSCIFCIFPQ